MGRTQIALQQVLSRTEQDLLEEYRAAWPRLREFYNSIRIEAVRSESLFKPKQSPQTTTTKLVYRSNGGRFLRMDETLVDSQPPNGGAAEKVTLSRPDGSVVLRRDGPEQAFVVQLWTGDPEEGKTRISIDHFQWSPYRFFVLDLQSVIFEKPQRMAATYGVRKADAFEEGGERLVRVETAGIDSFDGSEWRGCFVFLRDRAWALKEYEGGASERGLKESETASVRRARYEYGAMHQGVPLLKTLDFWVEMGPSRTRYQVDRFEVQKIEPGPVPEEEFSPASLGVNIGANR